MMPSPVRPTHDLIRSEVHDNELQFYVLETPTGQALLRRSRLGSEVDDHRRRRRRRSVP